MIFKERYLQIWKCKHFTQELNSHLSSVILKMLHHLKNKKILRNIHFVVQKTVMKTVMLAKVQIL